LPSDLLQYVVSVVLEPIRRDGLLRFVERQRASAHGSLQRVLHLVLGLGTDDRWRKWSVRSQRLARCTPHLRPQDLRIARMAAEFKGNEVILLVVGGRLVRIASRLKLLRLQ